MFKLGRLAAQARGTQCERCQRSMARRFTSMSTLTAMDLIRRKREGTNVFCIDEGESVFAATKLMVDYNVGSLAVTRNGRVC